MRDISRFAWFVVRFAFVYSLFSFFPAWSQVTLTFIHYNDLHAHLTPHWDLIADAQSSSSTRVVQRGGLARSATLIKQIRASAPNSVLMNIGDTYHGGVEALYSNGNAIVAPVNALGIDVGVPGNWDYAYGPIVTRQRYSGLSAGDRSLLARVSGMPQPTTTTQMPNFPNLAANVSYTQPAAKAGSLFLPATLIRNMGGVKVGFIGLSSDIVPMMDPILAWGLAFVQGETNYKNLINQYAAGLRAQGAQVVVVMSELGLQKNYRLAQIIKAGAVDVIFSAHTHEAVFTPLTSSSGAYVVEAGNDGYIGRMDMIVDQGKVIARQWQLIPIDASIPEDATMKALVEAARAPYLAPVVNVTQPMRGSTLTLTRPINSVVGYVYGALDRRSALESIFNDAFGEALRKRGHTQLSIAPGFRFDAVLAQPGILLEDNTVANGAITVEDAYRYFPVPITVSTGTTTAGQLKNMIETNLNTVFSPTAFDQAGGWTDGFGGIKLIVDLAATAGSRVQRMQLKDTGQILNGAMSVSVAGCTRPTDTAGVLCGYTGFQGVAALVNPISGQAWGMADLFMDMVAQGEVKPGVKSITDTHNTPLWPSIPYVQPLTGVSP